MSKTKGCLLGVALVFGGLILIGIFAEREDAPKSAANSEEAAAPKLPRFKEDRFGCTRREDFEKIRDLQGEGDVPAAQAKLDEGVLAGECTVFRKGEQVYMTLSLSLVAPIQVRRPGETTEYWTDYGWLDPAGESPGVPTPEAPPAAETVPSAPTPRRPDRPRAINDPAHDLTLYEALMRLRFQGRSIEDLKGCAYRGGVPLQVGSIVDEWVIYRYDFSSGDEAALQVAVLAEPGGYYGEGQMMREGSYYEVTGSARFKTYLGGTLMIPTARAADPYLEHCQRATAGGP